jgi:pectate lyase
MKYMVKLRILMKWKYRAILLLTLLCISNFGQAQLIIQERSAGFCATDGVLDSAVSSVGFTGKGYLDYVKFAKWSIDVAKAGNYTLSWRYALGGGNTANRDGQIYLNDVDLVDTVLFTHTGDWKTYQDASVHLQLEQGINEIRIRSFVTAYLPHIDYFKISESGVTSGDCITRYTLSLGINDDKAGTVSYQPVQEFYPAGTEITLTAVPKAGYFFQSWEGNDADTAKIYKLKIRKNTSLIGRFLPIGTKQVAGVIGYATVQDDNGTPYLLTGGSLGDTVAATTLEELQTYLSGDLPRVITLDRHIIGNNGHYLKIGSNKTLVGITDSAHIQGIRTQLEASKNVIIKKIKFSKTVTFDAMQINSGSEQIWIDSCEFFSDHDHDKDYYDGLLDIKNTSSFITVSHTKFHDHAKCILISSGDQELQDSVLRITFHHNYFYNSGSRLPSLRFGKAHIFNNYYKNNSGGINTRVGACIRVEKNLFEGNSGNMLLISGQAYYELMGNVGAGLTNPPVCQLDVPYEYQSVLEDDPNKLKLLWLDNVLPLVLESEDILDQVTIYPNPTSDKLYFTWIYREMSSLHVQIMDMSGVKIKEESITRGEAITLNELTSGIYIVQYGSKEIYSQQLIIVR